jgi:hypothetical protein
MRDANNVMVLHYMNIFLKLPNDVSRVLCSANDLNTNTYIPLDLCQVLIRFMLIPPGKRVGTVRRSFTSANF